jgi:hypothetical protein
VSGGLVFLRGDRRLTTLLLIFVLLSAADVLTTWIILLAGGYELNPLAALLIASFGFVGAIMVRIVVAAIVTFTICLDYTVSPKWARRAAVVLDLVMAVVVASNFLMIIGSLLSR